MVTRVHEVEVESGDALLKRVETASSHVGIQRGLAKLNDQKKALEAEIVSLDQKRGKILGDITSQGNIFDEATRRNQAFASALKVMTSFFSDGYTPSDLQRIRQALNLIQIKDRHQLSINRLVSGLEEAKTLVGLTDQIAERRKELETLQKQHQHG